MFIESFFSPNKSCHFSAMILKSVVGDLLSAPEAYIAQQCNCVTVRAHGLSQAIAVKYPWADVYKHRSVDGQRNRTTHPDVPGTVKVLASDNRSVICMFAQWAPGKCHASYSRFYPSALYSDDETSRRAWFKACLDKIDALNLDVVAIPAYIGCGLAGGSWVHYRKMIEAATTQFIIYKL